MKYLLITMKYLILFLFITSTVLAQYVPSGPRSSYNANADSTRIATGGPLRNYNDNGTWRKINPDYRLVSGSLVSDSGRHNVSVNLTNNYVRLNYKEYVLKIKVGALYAYRRSTDTRTKLADPNFSNRSYDGNIITIIDIYPNIDLKIINTSDNLQHQYIFHQAARNSFDTWWINNGSHDDIYLVNTLQLDIDSLGLTWNDDVGNFDCSTDRDITGKVKFKYGNVAKFLILLSRVELHAPPGNDTILYKRIMVISGNPYICEGFKWTSVRNWNDGDLVHNATFGESGDPGDFYRIVGNGHWGQKYTMGGSSGTLDSMYAYVNYKQNTAGSAYYDTIGFAIYTDNGGPDALVDSSTTKREVTAQAWKGCAMTGQTVSASTDYWLFEVATVNDGLETWMRLYRSSADKVTSYYNTDEFPPSATFVGSNSLNERPFYLYAVYTVSGEEAPNKSRRKKIIQLMN